MIDSVTMIDATHASVSNIPADTPKVAGYTTGTADIAWTPEDWARFPDAGHVRIDQGLGTFEPLSCDVFDIEAKAITPDQAVQGIRIRIAAGLTWTTIYAGRSSLLEFRYALADTSGPDGWYYGHVDAWLGDWNLPRAEAAALIGQELHGITLRAVQWASPSSNPAALVPGSLLTLREANVDLSVADPAWHTAAAPGNPWQSSALGLARESQRSLAGLEQLLLAHQ